MQQVEYFPFSFSLIGHYSVCELLVGASADITASMNGITPVELAQDMGHTGIYELLTQSQEQNSATKEEPDQQLMDQS